MLRALHSSDSGDAERQVGGGYLVSLLGLLFFGAILSVLGLPIFYQFSGDI